MYLDQTFSGEDLNTPVAAFLLTTKAFMLLSHFSRVCVVGWGCSTVGMLCVCKGCIHVYMGLCADVLGGFTCEQGYEYVWGWGCVDGSWGGVCVCVSVCVCVWLLAGIGGSIKDRKHTCPANGAQRKARLIGGCWIFRRGSWNSLGWVKLTPVKAGTKLR